MREKFDKLYNDFKEREKEEKRGSGIEVEYDENYQALTEIHDRIVEWEEAREVKETTEKKAAEEMRRKATKNLSATKKRTEGEKETKYESDEETPKKRRSHTNLVEVMKQSVVIKRTDQQEQRQLRQRELDIRAAEVQQQQQFQNMLLQQQQQQQAMNIAMLNAMGELLKNLKQ